MNRPNVRTNPRLQNGESNQYRALRRITGVYNVASTEKLRGIAVIEPLQAKLNYVSKAWAARAVTTDDPQITQFLELFPTKDPWYCNNPI